MSDRPWDDPADPKPKPSRDGNGGPTGEFIEWCKRSGKRRHTYMHSHGLIDMGREDAS